MYSVDKCSNKKFIGSVKDPEKFWSGMIKVVSRIPTNDWFSMIKVVSRIPTNGWSGKIKVVLRIPTNDWFSMITSHVVPLDPVLVKIVQNGQASFVTILLKKNKKCFSDTTQITDI